MVYKTNAPEEFMWEQESIHCIPVKYEAAATFYKVYRGSHTSVSYTHLDVYKRQYLYHSSISSGSNYTYKYL